MVVCMFRTLGWFNLWMDGWYIESKLVLLSYSVFGYQVVESKLVLYRSQYWLSRFIVWWMLHHKQVLELF